MIKAVVYLRTSTLTNVGPEKDSDERQRDAVTAYAARNGIEIVAEFYDANVKGADPITARPGFADMLDLIGCSDLRLILVEQASRFARDLIVQETGYAYLKGLGINLIAVDDPDAFLNDTPTGKLVRQILGAVSEFEKANLIAKMRRARDKKSQRSGRRCEGRKPVPADAIAIARSMYGRGASLRSISKALAGKSYVSPSGRPYLPGSIAKMVAEPSAESAEGRQSIWQVV